MTVRLHGVFTALVTPFTKNGAVDFKTFRDLCTRQIAAGIAGLVPCGTTGETPTLSKEEWRQLISIAVEESNGRVPVIAGCGSNDTKSTVENIAEAKELGADAALVVFPYYNKPNRQGLIAHVEQACSVGVPIVLYHVPGRTGQRLSVETLQLLCRIPGVIGLKEATGDVSFGQDVIQALQDTDVSLLSGDDFTYTALMVMGFHGVISVLSNPAPKLSVDWANAAKEGNIAEIQRLRKQLIPVVHTLFSQSNPLPCKAMMAEMGLLENMLRLPLFPIELENNQKSDIAFLE